jgi:hypothetical protein
MFKEDGDRLADLIYQKLTEKENHTLNTNEILDIYETFEYPILKKTEFYCWQNMDNRSDVVRFSKNGTRYVKLVDNSRRDTE